MRFPKFINTNTHLNIYTEVSHWTSSFDWEQTQVNITGTALIATGLAESWDTTSIWKGQTRIWFSLDTHFSHTSHLKIFTSSQRSNKYTKTPGSMPVGKMTDQIKFWPMKPEASKLFRTNRSWKKTVGFSLFPLLSRSQLSPIHEQESWLTG